MIKYANIKLMKSKSSSKGKAKYLIDDKEYFVEDAATLHYQKLGHAIIRSENYFWWHLLALLFWDIIYVKLDGVWTEAFGNFPSKSQDIPLDFFSDEFYQKRKDLINNKIKELTHFNLIEKASSSYKKNHNKPCRLIDSWDRYSLNDFTAVLEQNNSNNILKILERLLINFNDNRSGLPDLLVFNQKKFFFSEVKSENDKLSDNQKIWHSYLSDTLGYDVEVLLVNHTDKQIHKMQEKNNPLTQIQITVGNAASKYKEDAIALIKKQPSFFTSGEGKNAIFSAIFSTKNINTLYQILDYTSGWKSQKIEINDQLIKSGALRTSLYCYKRKIEEKASLDYCSKNEYENTINLFGCRSISQYELESNSWQESGYLDTETGSWIFDKDKIKEELYQTIEDIKYCPLLDINKTKKKIDTIVRTLHSVNPKNDNNWAYVSNDNEYWLWDKNKWKSEYGSTKFKGINTVVGVIKFDSSRIKEIKKTWESLANINSPINHKVKAPKKKKKKTGKIRYSIALILMIIGIFSFLGGALGAGLFYITISLLIFIFL
jgi:hypothetical protein